jgi:Ca-activated chloride channel family protein
MIGQPLDVSRQLIRDLFTSLRPTDCFNVVLFAGGSKVLAPTRSLPALPENLAAVLDAITDVDAGGGTELVEALETAYALPDEPGMARSVIVITDGEIAAGGASFRTVRSQLGSANTFAFGVGAAVNRPVIELLARAGNGEPFVLTDFSASDQIVGRLRAYIDRPLLTDIVVRAEGLDAFDLEPAVVPDLLAERPLMVIGRYRGPAQGSMVIDGLGGDGPYHASVTSQANAISPQLSALRLLWARTHMQRLLDEQSSAGWGSAENDTNAAAITELALAYGMLSPYTSFVAVDEVVRTTQDSVAVQQPAIGKSTGRIVEESPPVAAAPAPRPLMYQRVAGTGSAPGLLRMLGAATGMHLRSAGHVAMSRMIGERNFQLHDTTWVDSRYRDDMTLLRLRADSPALTRLLQAKPELAAAIALGKRVIIVVGEIAVLVSAEGFSSYPESILQILLRR